MRKKFSGALAILAAFLLILPGCKGDKADAQPEVERDSIPIEEKELEAATGESIKEIMEPQLSFTDEEQELLEQLGYKESPDDKLRALQASLVEINILSIEDSAASLEISAPDLAALLNQCIENIDTQRSDAAEAVKNAMAEKLSAGDYSEKLSTVSVNCSRGEDGALVIEENAEYLDAIYGGLISLERSYTEQMIGVIE